MSSELILFSTDHCALCEEALELIFSMPELAGYSVRTVDVAEADSLMELYGERLPVLLVKHRGVDQELDWPFDASSVLESLSEPD